MMLKSTFEFLADLGDLGQFFLINPVGRRQHELLLANIGILLASDERSSNVLKAFLRGDILARHVHQRTRLGVETFDRHLR